MLLERRAVDIDPDGKTVSIRSPDGGEKDLLKDKLILGTAAVSIKAKLQDIELLRIFLLRWMDETLRLNDSIEERAPKTAVIVDSGYIGMEMAKAFA